MTSQMWHHQFENNKDLTPVDWERMAALYRLFTAIDIPEDAAARLAAICFGLPGARWVPIEQMHLTLRFIGEVDGGVFRDIREALADVGCPAFSMRLKGLGCFPPRKKPRVLWAGVEPADEVARLRNKIENTLVRAGLAPEKRKFSPHITMARFRETSSFKVGQYLAGNNLFATPFFEVREFYLYSSKLTPKGAIHRIEATYPLSLS